MTHSEFWLKLCNTTQAHYRGPDTANTLHNMDPKESDLLLAGDLAIKQKEEKTDSLVQAKDRGQATATAAMSIVNISLLKEVIDKGPGYNWYTVMLSLISLSLALQILVGLISIFTINTKSYYESFRNHSLHDCCAMVCQCRIKRKKKRKEAPKEQDRGKQMTEFIDCMYVKSRTIQEEMDEEEAASGCCPFICTTRILSNFEYGVLEKHEADIQRLIHAEVSSVEIGEELQYLTKAVQDAKAEQARLEVLAEDPKADKEGISAKLRALSDELAEAQKRKQDYEAKMKDTRILKGQCQAVQRYADAIVKNQVLKNVAFWQHGINYLLYVVFILNAFITGLGISGGSMVSGSVANTTAP